MTTETNRPVPKDAELRRTVPFLATTGGHFFALDNVLLREGQPPSTELLRKISHSLDLTSIQPEFSAGVAEVIVEEQYDVCLNHVFSHPFWELLRQGRGHKQLYTYMLETRHYLYAAVSRMSPGAAGCRRDPRLTRILTDHVVEEADHAKYFEAALVNAGMPANLIGLTRPIPQTLEWIYLMRGLAFGDPLTAALCSGLMEYSSVDRQLVMDWHTMLVQADLVPEASAEAMLDHIRLDMELDHGNNWREALRAAQPIAAIRLADGLNAVCAVTEMIVRWLDSISAGTTGLLVMSPEIALDPEIANSGPIDIVFNGCPTWPAEIYHALSYGTASENADAVIAWAYSIGRRGISPDMPPMIDRASAIARRLARDPIESRSVPGVLDEVKSWLRAIDGHRLWQSMLDQPSITLTKGWILENYFYLASAPYHTGAALAACPDDVVRAHLVRHMEEEAHHSELLARGLASSAGWLDLSNCRPLPTTIAFTTFLEDLAGRNWVAYCIALVYLQLTLDARAPKHEEFYKSITQRCPEATALLQSMRDHDSLDQELGHESDMYAMLESLVSRWQIGDGVLRQAAMIVPLGWSFLDGIHQHFSRGESSIPQRIGWHA